MQCVSQVSSLKTRKLSFLFWSPENRSLHTLPCCPTLRGPTPTRSPLLASVCQMLCNTQNLYEAMRQAPLKDTSSLSPPSRHPDLLKVSVRLLPNSCLSLLALLMALVDNTTKLWVLHMSGIQSLLALHRLLCMVPNKAPSSLWHQSPRHLRLLLPQLSLGLPNPQSLT
jgi:hypothetical protein